MNTNISIILCLATFLLLPSVALATTTTTSIYQCGFMADGVFYPNSIVVDKTTDIELVSDGSCGSLLAVAVGGGGTSYQDAGSGSGYVEFIEISHNTTSGQFCAEVGMAQEATMLTDMSDGSTLLTANPGGVGGTAEGADGYSGGGGDGNGGGFGGDGGTDGGEGDDSDYPGGSGSGLDISTIPLKNVVISPGSGGQAGVSSGGGGGGVLVDGRGPSGGGPEHGQGFGAGGGGTIYGSEPLTMRGYSGVIVLDFI